MTEFLVLGLTAAIVFFFWKSRRNYTSLEELPLSEGNTQDVTVVIPARNEDHQIERVLRSFPNVPVIVVDDDSSDHTAARARNAGALVIAAPSLPPGAKGKPNACAEGARQVSTKWILFVDADTWFDAPFLNSLVGYAERHRLNLVTAFLKQHCETLLEQALLPYAFALYFTGVNSRSVNDGDSREALANGQCMLFERSSYEAIGGHASVIDSVIEDVALARLAKRHKLNLRVIRAENVGHVRMYDSMSGIWRGFQKNSFRFLLVNPSSALQVITASILATSWLPVLLLSYFDLPQVPERVWLLTITPAILLFLAPFVLLWSWYRSRVLLAPLGIYLFQVIALNGMFTTLARRKALWKERHV